MSFTFTDTDIVRLWRTMQHEVQTGSRTVLQTGSTNNSTTETDIDAISVAKPMFGGRGRLFTGLYANLTRRFNLIHPEIPRRRTDTEISYNFAMRRKTISR